MIRLLTLALLIAAAPLSAAQEAVRVIVGFPAGATLDVMTRVMAENMHLTLGRPVIVWGPAIRASGFKAGE